MKIVSVAAELLFLSVNSKLFLPGFLSLIASLQTTAVVLSPYRCLQIALFEHSDDRHAYSCLVAVPACEIILLDEHYSPRPFKEFVIVLKITSVTGRPTLSCFQVISLAGRFTAYLCHCMAAIQHFFLLLITSEM